MDIKDFEKITDDIKEKLGTENTGLIADDLALLINDNASMNNLILEKDNNIKDLEEKNKNILITNGNLLQQVSMTNKGMEEEKEEKEEKLEKINLKNAFDEKRKFY